MLTLIRTLRRAIRARDDTATGVAFRELMTLIGREKALALAHRLFRRVP